MLKLYNTLTRQKEEFKPIDPKRVTLYACGPTVYNYIHIGNARMIVVFDLLYRVLRQIYGEKHVVYARNITDVDDKIIEAAKKENVAIDAITKKYTVGLLEDLKGVNALEPDFQPLATEYIPQMIAMIETLIANGHAYEAEGHVLFNVPSYKDYGKLSRRDRDEQIAGARVEVAPYKRDPADFVLWKPSTPDLPGWDSPWGRGRPGWHIECSAMSTEILGKTFDIHGGGLDLTFPHHENEIAQSCCANKRDQFANLWMHNGFINVDNEKMSKSLGNFRLLHDLLKEYPGEAIRYALLSAHYRQPAEFNLDLLKDAKGILDRWYRVLEKFPDTEATKPTDAFIAALADDLNTPEAFAELHRLAKSDDIGAFKASANLLGLMQSSAKEWFRGGHPFEEAEINQALAARIAAKQAKNYAEADRIRKELADKGIQIDDISATETTWRRA
jgi:cysteinyl-tRNA synthetase